MSFKDLVIKRAYSSDRDDILRDFYIPVLSESIEYHRIAGFFSSTSLAIAAKGIVGLISNKGTMKMIVSPRLTPQDLKMLIQANLTPQEFAEKKMLEEIDNLEDQLIADHVRALGWLIAHNKLHIKVAIRDHSIDMIPVQYYERITLFHQKIGILKDMENNIIAFSGSINETASGWLNNIEEFKVFRSWESVENDYIDADVNKFNDFWNNSSSRVRVFPIPEAVRMKLIELAPKDIKQIDLWEWYKGESTHVTNNVVLFDHQQQAVQSWLDHDMKGIFEMATGTGKTFAAIDCVDKAIKLHKRLVAIISCPLQHLVNQWEREIANYGLAHQILIADSTNPKWKSTLTDKLLDISNRHQNTLIVITTHRTLSSASFEQIIGYLDPKVVIMLVADEVHGIGAEKSKRGLLEKYRLRLGLSATPKRWFDSIGTQVIYEYFGDVIFEFGLREAISSINPATGMTYLSPYRYVPVFITLNTNEIKEYYETTKSIVKMYHNKNKDENKADVLDNLIFKRANVVKNADEKYTALEQIIRMIGHDIRWTIIYSTPQQIDNVMGLLDRLGIIHKHQFTMEEGTKAESKYGGLSERDYILERFAAGEYRVLVAMKCLDEGVDIPPARKAILMASSGNPREYIQRIGRVIRRFAGKEEATIYDLIVKPDFKDLPTELVEIEKKILKKELERSMEIAQLAINNVESVKALLDVSKSTTGGE